MAETCGQCRWHHRYTPEQMELRRAKSRAWDVLTDGWCKGACAYGGDDVDSGNEYAPAHCGGFKPRKEDDA